MIHGTVNIPQVVEESICRSSKNYRFADVGIYKIHSTTLMPNIPFEEARIQTEEIDKSIFVNDEETMPTFNSTVKCQNFLSTRYIGRAPLEWYGGSGKTNFGRKFILICRYGNPHADYRVFGTETAIHGYNKNAADNVKLPGGGEE